MRTRDQDAETGGAGPGVGAAIKEVTDHAKQLVSLHVELAKLELAQKAKAFGVGIGLLLGAAVFGLLALGFLLATLAAALATFLATWLALLIVTVLLLAIAAILGLVGVKRLRPPVPQQAIEEAKKTTEALKSDGSSG